MTTTRRRWLRWLLCTGTALVPAAALAGDLPSGGSVVHGNVTITRPATGQMRLNQGSDKAIINWGDFSIGQGKAVDIRQPSASAMMLNRVTGNLPSRLDGALVANGKVILVNPNGIAIGPSGRINTNAFVASTLGITDSDFREGRLRFSGKDPSETGASATVSNAGQIVVDGQGYAALLGGKVRNSGTILVPMGRIGLGAGEKITLDPSGEGFLQVALPSSDTDPAQLIDSSGTLEANGGLIEIKAATARNAARHAINLTGIAEASTVSGRNGAVILGGGPGGRVTVKGKILTTGKAAQTTLRSSPKPRARPAQGGGAITITGNRIELRGATLDASGVDGGGSIRIGGDPKGEGNLLRAQFTGVDALTTLRADATGSGSGGDIVLWSDGLTAFEGRISAKGGPAGGDGGFVEVSGKVQLAFTGLVDTTAPKGTIGTLLIDPYNVTITDDPTGVNWSESGGNYLPTGDDSEIPAALIATNLLTTDVFITTDNGSLGTQAGDITVNADLSWGSAFSLTLQAANNILLNTGDITATGGGGVTLSAGGSIETLSDISIGSGALSMVALTGIDLGGEVAAGTGTISLSAPQINLNAPVSAASLYISALAGNGAAGDIQLGTGADIAVGSFTLEAGNWQQVGVGIAGFSADDFQLGSDMTTRSFLRALGGNGSETNPYRITDIYGLQGIDSAELLPFSYILANNIDASGTAGWNYRDDLTVYQGFNPIGQMQGGTPLHAFTGTLDGNNRQITGLETRWDSYSGLFEVIGAGGTVENLRIASSFADGLSTDSSVGMLAAVNLGDVDNIILRDISLTSNGGLAGLLIGDNRGAVTLASAQGAIDVTLDYSAANTNVGGLIGWGRGSGAHVWASRAEADISVSGATYFDVVRVGGLIGQSDGSVIDSFAGAWLTGNRPAITVDVQDSTILFVGGLIGDAAGYVQRAYSDVSLDVADPSGYATIQAGGLIGWNTAEVQDTYSVSDVRVETTGDSMIGGLIGVSTGADVVRSYAAGSVTATGNALIGGFVGESGSSTYSGNFWDRQATGVTVSSGTAGVNAATSLTTAQLQNQTYFRNLATPLGWSFLTTWAPPGDGNYPELYTLTPVVWANPDNATVTYGASKTPAFTGSFYGGPGVYLFGTSGDNLALTYTSQGGAGSNAGTYAITAEDEATSTLGQSYRVISSRGNFSVTPATLTITARDKSKTYGDRLTFGPGDIIVKGLAGGDSLTGITLRSDGAPAWAAVAGDSSAGTALGGGWYTYPIYVSDATGKGIGNYNIVYQAGDLTVTPRNVVVTIDNQSKTFGQTLSFSGSEFSATGLVNGNRLTGIALQSAGAAPGALISDSPYAITQIGDGSPEGSGLSTRGISNYTFEFVPGTLTVTSPDDGYDLSLDGNTTVRFLNPQVLSKFHWDNGLLLPVEFIPGDDEEAIMQGGGARELFTTRQALLSVETVSSNLNQDAVICATLADNIDVYLDCIAGAMGTYAAELDELLKPMPDVAANVSAVIRDAERAVGAAGIRARNRLAEATTDEQRQQIRSEAIAEARQAVARAGGEIRKSISLIRADDPVLARVQRQQIVEVASAFDRLDGELVRVSEL
ncbi:filamentous hemagglutinin N-terminal domain-containing protein [Tropicimonas sp.]|uniref:two-partner secretion domain-containing protein n=1 Tax=Tropicimonas sp. TaxID=2067044 RepID=UPI003A86F1F6